MDKTRRHRRRAGQPALTPPENGERRTGAELAAIFAQVHDIAGLIRLSRHCVDRYRERFKPELSTSSARSDLYRRMRAGGIFTVEKPRWILMSGSAALGWIVIDDDIALPIREDIANEHSLVAVTALYRLQ